MDFGDFFPLVKMKLCLAKSTMGGWREELIEQEG
jgi:hypothetical protein